MSVAAAATEREVREILHYTSENGVMGSVIVDSLLSREQVEQNEAVAYIYEGVWDRSRDIEWVDYISMSLSTINADLFARSRAKHPTWWWAIMSFPPDILDDPGLVFTTTNNAYHETCQRAEGLEGFEAMFEPRVPWGHHGSVATRSRSHPLNRPTHWAAEVLYPKCLPLGRLQALYLPDERKRSLVSTWCEIYARAELPIRVAPELFA